VICHDQSVIASIDAATNMAKCGCSVSSPIVGNAGTSTLLPTFHIFSLPSLLPQPLLGVTTGGIDKQNDAPEAIERPGHGLCRHDASDRVGRCSPSPELAFRPFRPDRSAELGQSGQHDLGRYVSTPPC